MSIEAQRVALLHIAQTEGFEVYREFVEVETSKGAAELGPDVEPFVLHLFAALAEKERSAISTRTRQALAAANARGITLDIGCPLLMGISSKPRKIWDPAVGLTANNDHKRSV